MSMIKRCIGLLVVLCLVLSVIPVTAYAEIIGRGYCGSHLTWTLDRDGLLTISGTGAMYDYSSLSFEPWSSKRTEIKSVFISDGVTSIGNYAFRKCSSLTSITISDSVTSIGNYAFRECSSLTSITIPDGVTSIGYEAFYKCISLTSITIPDGVTSIGNDTFYGCTGLTSITIPDSVTSIGDYAFYECISLTSITIPGGVTSIGRNAFWGCSSLTTVNITDLAAWCMINFGNIDSNPLSCAENLHLNGQLVTDLIIPDGVTSIGVGAFYKCDSLASITIPDGVTSIGEYAFYGCTGLTSITIPDSVTSIGSRGFAGCSALQSVKLPKNLLEIGARTFGSCYALSSIDIPDGVVCIGKEAFDGCKNLKTVSIPDTVQVICEYAFLECEQLTDIVIPYGVQAIWRGTFQKCYNLQSISIPVTVKTIEGGVFKECNALTDVYYTGSEEQWNNIIFYAKNAFVNTARFHYMGTEQYDDTIIETEIQLKKEGQADYIDRFLLPTIGQNFYSWLEESTDGDGINDVLIYDVNEYCPGMYNYRIRIPISCDNAGDLIVKLEREMHALPKTVEAVYSLFRLEHEDVTWLSSVFSYSYNSGKINDTEGYMEIEPSIYFRSIDKNKYYDSIDLRDRMIAEIISYIPENASDYEKIRYFNAYLTRSNCFNSDSPNEPSSAHEAVTALEGNAGSNGPVCEAYARAFELLCESQDIPCATIIGKANNTGHAWNLVQMDDGNWYAVDVTWNDPIVPNVISPVSGYERETYLLVGKETVLGDMSFSESHQESVREKIPNTSIPIPKGPILNKSKYIPKENTDHIAISDHSQAVKPTCTENGLTAGTYCYICNEILSAQVVIPAPGHTEDIIPAVSPTCTEPGLTEGKNCSVCGEILVAQESIDALGHDMSQWERITAPTCTEDGTENRSCSRCDRIETRAIEATGHRYNAVSTVPTCTEKGYTIHTCANCNDSYTDTFVDALGHAMGNWVTDSEPTCTEDGKQHRVCFRCTYSEKRTIEATGHSYTTVITGPTCTGQGYTTYTCSCGDSYVSDYVDALGHDMGEWKTVTAPTCTENGSETRSCSHCDYTETRAVDAVGHSYTTAITAPTCTEQGYTTYTCSCGDSYVSDYVDAVGHNMGEWKIVTAPTCTEEGSESRSCSRCDRTETRSIDAVGHSYTGTVTAPTCTEQGFTTYTCSCGDTYVSDMIPALGHTEETIPAVTATCIETGLTEGKKCSVCGEVLVAREVEPALGHDWKGTSCQRCNATRENPFTDVADGSFYIDPVLWAVENGITNGTTPTTFNPNGTCLRAHVVTFLYRAAKSPEPSATKNPFNDVKPGDFYYKPVLWAVEKGITNGISSTKFGSMDVCNRAAVVTFLWRAAGSPEPESTNNPFEDVKTTDFFYRPVLWAVENGITNGVDATHFGPATDCNRAQVVTFLYRAYN